MNVVYCSVNIDIHDHVFCSCRRKNKFRVFGGLWFGEGKPFFSTFLKPFVDTLHETEINGKLHVLYENIRFKICSNTPSFLVLAFVACKTSTMCK